MMEIYFWVTIGACAVSVLFSILTIRSLNLQGAHLRSVRNSQTAESEEEDSD